MNNMANSDPTGGLQVRVSSGTGAFPIENAVVLISPMDKTGVENGVIKSLRTDESGLTETVSLPAKPRELSENPGNIDPYNSYNVEIRKEGYYPVVAMNVPVFEGVNATLPVTLVPVGYGVTPGSIGFNENRVFNDITTGDDLN